MLSESSKAVVLYILNATQLAVNDDYNLLSEAKGYNPTYIKAYGKKSNTNCATVGTASVPVYYPVKAVMSNDNGYETDNLYTLYHSETIYCASKPFMGRLQSYIRRWWLSMWILV